jgi:hypothetical protein
VNWVKPYLRAINKLRSAEMNKPDIVTAFETSFLEINLDAVHENLDANGKSVYGEFLPVVRVIFEQTTSPGEVYQRNYQKGFVHRGRVKIKMEAWIYTVKKYEEEQKKENEELIDFLASNVDESIQAMKEDLVRLMKKDYEALWQKEKDEKKQPKRRLNVAHSIRELFPFVNYFIPEKEEGGEKKEALVSRFNPQARYAERKRLEAAMGLFLTSVGEDRDETKKALYKLYDAFKACFGLLRPPS